MIHEDLEKHHGRWVSTFLVYMLALWLTYYLLSPFFWQGHHDACITHHVVLGSSRTLSEHIGKCMLANIIHWDEFIMRETRLIDCKCTASLRNRDGECMFFPTLCDWLLFQFLNKCYCTVWIHVIGWWECLGALLPEHEPNGGLVIEWCLGKSLAWCQCKRFILCSSMRLLH